MPVTRTAQRWTDSAPTRVIQTHTSPIYSVSNLYYGVSDYWRKANPASLVVGSHYVNVVQTIQPRYEVSGPVTQTSDEQWEAAGLMAVTSVENWEAESLIAQTQAEQWEALFGVVKTIQPRYE